ncbi:MAG: hypothetical protein K2F94_09270, partial [Muribaculaceae bacterium]|nr:hypothetical protein [Muribaculaceae bacterium]
MSAISNIEFMLSAKSYKLSSSLIVLFLVFAGCIKNDLPYPKIQQNITSIGVDGESRAALIDSASMTVTLYLDETADIEALSFTSFS